MRAYVVGVEPKQERSRATRERLLEAAVAELTESGYVGFSGARAAQRAGVSRGALQNHFPTTTALVAAAVRRLSRLQTEELREALKLVGRGAVRRRTALDVIFAQYGSARFATVIELSLAARLEPELHAVVSAEERAIAAELTEVATDVLGPERAARRENAERWATALAATRGVALLKLFGHSANSVERQWKATRRELVRLLDERRG